MQGEITAELDSAKTKALDNYYKNIYAGHFYGHTYTTILESLDKITKEDVINSYNVIVSTSKKSCLLWAIWILVRSKKP